MPEPPRRFKDVAELTVAEHLERGRTGRLPETDEYIEARRKALLDAGLEPDDGPPADMDEWTPDDHLKAIRKDR